MKKIKILLLLTVMMLLSACETDLQGKETGKNNTVSSSAISCVQTEESVSDYDDFDIEYDNNGDEVLVQYSHFSTNPKIKIDRIKIENLDDIWYVGNGCIIYSVVYYTDYKEVLEIYRIPLLKGSAGEDDKMEPDKTERLFSCQEEGDLSQVDEISSDGTIEIFFVNSEYMIYALDDMCIRFDFKTKEKFPVQGDVSSEEIEYKDIHTLNYAIDSNYSEEFFQNCWESEEETYLFYDKKNGTLVSPDIGKVERIYLFRGPQILEMGIYKDKLYYRAEKEKDIRCYDFSSGEKTYALRQKQVRKLLKEQNLWKAGLDWEFYILGEHDGDIIIQLSLTWIEKDGSGYAEHFAEVVARCVDGDFGKLKYDKAISTFLQTNTKKCKSQNTRNYASWCSGKYGKEVYCTSYDTGFPQSIKENFLYIYFHNYHKKGNDVLGLYNMTNGTWEKEKIRNGGEK